MHLLLFYLYCNGASISHTPLQPGHKRVRLPQLQQESLVGLSLGSALQDHIDAPALLVLSILVRPECAHAIFASAFGRQE